MSNLSPQTKFLGGRTLLKGCGALGLVLVGLFPAGSLLFNGRAFYEQGPLLEGGGRLLFSTWHFGALLLCAVGALAGGRANGIAKTLFTYFAVVSITSLANVGPSEVVGILYGGLIVWCVGHYAGDQMQRSWILLRSVLRLYLLVPLVLLFYWPELVLLPPEVSGRDALGGLSRFVGLAPSPAYMGTISCMALICELWATKKGKGRIGVIAIIVCVNLATQSRTSLILLAMIVLIYLFRKKLTESRNAWLYSIIAFSLTVPVVALSWYADWMMEFTTMRIEVWRIALQEFASNPVFGVGPVLFSETYWNRAEYEEGNFANSHNQLLESLATFGIVGGVTCVAVLCICVIYVRKSALPTAALSLAAFALVVVQLPFGTPLRVSGLSFNLFPLVFLVVACSLRFSVSVAPPKGALHKREWRFEAAGVE